jgi:hypothetical protein
MVNRHSDGTVGAFYNILPLLIPFLLYLSFMTFNSTFLTDWEDLTGLHGTFQLTSDWNSEKAPCPYSAHGRACRENGSAAEVNTVR